MLRKIHIIKSLLNVNRDEKAPKFCLAKSVLFRSSQLVLINSCNRKSKWGCSSDGIALAQHARGTGSIPHISILFLECLFILFNFSKNFPTLYMKQDVAQMVERLLSRPGGKGIDKHSISIVFHNFIYALISLLAGPST